MVNRPFDLLNEAIGKEVLVVLKENISIRGKLTAFDVHMNIVLENAVQLEGNQPKTNFGNLIVRGDNILYVSPEKGE